MEPKNLPIGFISLAFGMAAINAMESNPRDDDQSVVEAIRARAEADRRLNEIARRRYERRTGGSLLHKAMRAKARV